MDAVTNNNTGLYPLPASSSDHRAQRGYPCYTPETPGDLYADVMRELDWSVGQILTSLKALDLEANTLVIFTSDNGPWFGGSTGGLRGMKGSTLEGGLREPMIARWPGRLPAGQVRHQPCSTLDLFPTILRLVGVPLPADRVIDGRDIWPVLRDDAPSPHPALFGLVGHVPASVRSGRWKLHVLQPSLSYLKVDISKLAPPDGVSRIAPYEQYHDHSAFPGVLTGDPLQHMMLFDLEADPAEQHNVAAQHPEVTERLVALFRAFELQVPKDIKPIRPKPREWLKGPPPIPPGKPVPVADTLPVKE